MSKPEKPALFDIWEEEAVRGLTWRVQLVGYIAFFPSEEKAKSYVDAMKKVGII
jgi:hypothetical protein